MKSLQIHLAVCLFSVIWLVGFKPTFGNQIDNAKFHTEDLKFEGFKEEVQLETADFSLHGYSQNVRVRRSPARGYSPPLRVITFNIQNYAHARSAPERDADIVNVSTQAAMVIKM